jgi:hypothetical protein
MGNCLGYTLIFVLLGIVLVLMIPIAFVLVASMGLLIMGALFL